MKATTHTRRLAAALTCALSATAVAAPAALADPPAGHRATPAVPAVDTDKLRPQQPDALERHLQRERAGGSAIVVDDDEFAPARPDGLDRWLAGSGPGRVDIHLRRDPHERPARPVDTFVVSQPAGGFQWDDMAVGIAAGLGFAALGVAFLRRARLRPVA